MWIVIVSILVIFLVCLAFWRIIWAICKPIFVYIYTSLINLLRGTGMTEQAAKAIISIVIIILLILFVLCS